MQADAAATVSVATYNVHRCVGRDGRKDPARIAAVLRTMESDIVGLQEVESHGPRGGAAHQLDYLAGEGGYRAIAGPTMTQPEGHYGNALLTRGDVVDVVRHVFEGTRGEPRGAVEARVEVRGHAVRTIVTHLGLRAVERKEQVAQILDIVAEDNGNPTILLGDFNEWLPFSRARRRLRNRFGNIPTPPTFPAWRPLLALDHIWVHPPRALQRLESIRTPSSQIASDHLPVRAIVSLRRLPDSRVDGHALHSRS